MVTNCIDVPSLLPEQLITSLAYQEPRPKQRATPKNPFPEGFVPKKTVNYITGEIIDRICWSGNDF